MIELREEIKEVLQAFPLLKKINNNSLKGLIHLKRSYNDIPIYINYEIEIFIPNNYPDRLPIVKEIGNKINSEYSHISNSRELCLATDGDIKISLYPDYKLFDFVNIYVISYLYTHSYFIKYKVFPFGERSHGVEGILEFYMEHFNLDNKKQVKSLLKLISLKRCKGHFWCYCESGKKNRNCHKDEIQKFRESDFKYIYIKDYKLINEVKEC